METERQRVGHVDNRRNYGERERERREKAKTELEERKQIKRDRGS